MLKLKKISKFIKDNYKFLIGVIVGLLLSATGVYAANTIYSSNVTYDNSNSGLEATNVQDALDETYNKCIPTLYKELYSNAVMDNISSTYVSSVSGIDFSEDPSDTNGKGIYIRSGTENNSNPILYYRGDVNNNNLIFADTCWKIVRTTETGGIKLIYNGVPSASGTCNNTGEDSQIGKSSFNSSSNSPAYVGYMYGNVYNTSYRDLFSDIGNSDTYYYGKDVTYSNGEYSLVDAVIGYSLNPDWGVHGNPDAFIYNHYTCYSKSSTGTCSTVYYIIDTGGLDGATSISLTGGKNIEGALDEMLNNNTNSSTIKTKLDDWYKANIANMGVSNYVEDTIWCNNRSINRIGAFNPNGGWGSLEFVNIYESSPYYTPLKLTCERELDSFTVNKENGNGDLDYPIGLITADEVIFAGEDNSYLMTDKSWWTLTPYYFDTSSEIYEVSCSSYSCNLRGAFPNSDYGVRPSISLKPGTEIIGGDGSVENPYIIN